MTPAPEVQASRDLLPRLRPHPAQRLARQCDHRTKDNQRAADFLLEEIGPNNSFVQWVVVRPDSLLEGEVSEYALHEGLVNSLFAPGSTNRANVAHFMCELVTNPKTWADWKGRLPVITNAEASSVATRRPG